MLKVLSIVLALFFAKCVPVDCTVSDEYVSCDSFPVEVLRVTGHTDDTITTLYTEGYTVVVSDDTVTLTIEHK